MEDSNTTVNTIEHIFLGWRLRSGTGNCSLGMMLWWPEHTVPMMRNDISLLEERKLFPDKLSLLNYPFIQVLYFICVFYHRKMYKRWFIIDAQRGYNNCLILHGAFLRNIYPAQHDRLFFYISNMESLSYVGYFDNFSSKIHFLLWWVYQQPKLRNRNIVNHKNPGRQKALTYSRNVRPLLLIVNQIETP